MNSLRATSSAILIGMITLTAPVGCMVGPDFEKPDVVTPDHWHAELVENIKLDKDGAGEWWKSFDDPVLVELVERAQRNNLDLRVMYSRISAARAKYGIAASNLFPMIDGTGNATWYRADSGVSPIAGDLDPSGNSYALGLQMTWELDLWGRVRRTMDARQMDILAAMENWRDMLVTLRAEVASSYINYRTYRARLELLELAVLAARIAVQISQEEYEAGTVPLMDVLNARSQLLNFEAELPGLKADAAESINQLSVLLGEAPGYLGTLIDDAGTIPTPSVEIAVGIPADVIRQRPDVRSAERTLAAEVNLIGATEALLLPQIYLNGGVGMQSSAASNLLNWSSRNWSIGPSATWSLLNWGQISSEIDEQKAVTQEAMLDYQRVVLTAYQDVENALVGFAAYTVARRDTASSRDDTLQSLILMLQSYEVGTVDMTSVIEVELNYLDSELSLLNLEGQVAQAAVSIYKATGGDWTPILPGENGPIPVPSDSKTVAVVDDGEAQ